MKNLGITKVVRKSKTRIERATKDGAFVVERDESVLIPLPIFIAAWKQLKSAVSKELLGEENDFEIEELTSVEFRIAQIEDDPNDVQLSSIICKGRLFLGRHTDFANAHFYDEDSLKIATQLYKAAADYFDGKNAQMEMPFPQLPEGAESMKMSTMDGRFGVKITKDGIETIRDSIVPEEPILEAEKNK